MAAIELGFVTILFVVPLIIAIWEVGRIIHVKQIVANSARVAVRLAAQGYTILSNGTQVQINTSTWDAERHTDRLRLFAGAGLSNLVLSDVTVTFTFTSPSSRGRIPLSHTRGLRVRRSRCM